MDRQTGAGTERRPVGARDDGRIRAAAAGLARCGISPNAISLASIAFAGLGAWALVATPSAGPWLCAVGILLRLLCNVFDGLVAVEHGRQTPTGPLFNEVPDRIADSVLLVALGHAAGLVEAGWLAALLAGLTAYVRTLGGALGQPQDFRGPMAKQHRMWLMLVACLVAPLEHRLSGGVLALQAAVWIIAAGAALTCMTRLRAIARRLDSAR